MFMDRICGILLFWFNILSLSCDQLPIGLGYNQNKSIRKGCDHRLPSLGGWSGQTGRVERGYQTGRVGRFHSGVLGADPFPL